MAKEPESKKARANKFEYVEPIGLRVLVRKDEPKKETKGGIALPDAAEIPTITGRIVTISAAIEHDEDFVHGRVGRCWDGESDEGVFVRVLF